MKDLIIGIDAGTSVIKSIAFTLQGEQLDSASVENEYELISGGGAEQDLDLTWNKTLQTLQMLSEKLPGLAERTAAIAVTGQGDGTWLIDKHGKPAAKALLWLDARAADIADEISASAADPVRFNSTGTGLAACQQGPQLNWIKQNNPTALDIAAHALHCKDWLYYKLTGDIATDVSEGNFTFGSFRSRQYSDDVIEALRLTAHKSLLPPIVEGTEVCGELASDVAGLCKLLEGTPVVLAYVDVACTALGAGLYDPQAESGCSIIGSTGMHMRLVRSSADAVLNQDRSGYTMCLPVPGAVAQMQSNMSATLNIDWLLDTAAGLLQSLGVNKDRKDLISNLDTWVGSAQAGSLLYQPYISEAGERGPFVDANARAGFVGLSQQHRFEDLARAVVEGLCLAARDCYQSMGELPDVIRLSGGASRSKALLSILSACLSARVCASTRDEAGAAGAAMMAAVAIGHYKNMDDCVAEWVVPYTGELTEPDATLAATYDELYPAYASAHKALRPVWQSMNLNSPTAGNAKPGPGSEST